MRERQTINNKIPTIETMPRVKEGSKNIDVTETAETHSISYICYIKINSNEEI